MVAFPSEFVPNRRGDGKRRPELLVVIPWKRPGEPAERPLPSTGGPLSGHYPSCQESELETPHGSDDLLQIPTEKPSCFNFTTNVNGFVALFKMIERPS